MVQSVLIREIKFYCMSKLSLFVLLLSTFSIVSFAQTINGTIADLQTKQVLPFVNIGIVGRDVGTVSDEVPFI